MGGVDSTWTSVAGLELFDSKTKIISKVMDEQNNWINTPKPGLAATSVSTCALPLIDKNAFILSGGRRLQSQGFLYFSDVIMFHTDTR